MAIQTQNPVNGEIIKKFEAHTDAQVDEAIKASLSAHKILRNWSFEDRAKAMQKAGDILEKEAEDFGKIMTLEMGKTFKSAVAEAKKCAWVCRHYAERAEGYLADESVESGASKSYRKYLPIGPVLAVMPWNYPVSYTHLTLLTSDLV